ncbi:MAG: enzyme of heme biosynthesis [Rikenellaceae bacterium]
MKRFQLLLVMTFVIAAKAMAQGSDVDFNAPQYAMWGETAEEREKNMYASNFLTEAVTSKDYDGAVKYFQQILANCPAASEAVFARGVLIYRAKIGRAKTLADKKMMIDSLMIVHDLRLQYFANHAKRGRVYILDSKARDFLKYAKGDREGLRKAFRESIEASGAEADPTMVLTYFQNLCDDYKMDEVMADEVLAEYDKLAPFFEALTGEEVEMAEQFDNLFGTSGVASCENLEAIYGAKLEATPNDEKLLSKTIKLLDRTGCATPFYNKVAEKLYLVAPSAESAMALATIFQNEGDYSKASRYLRDALAETSDLEEQEQLYSRIALIELAASNNSEALKAAKAALAVADGTRKDNGVALFIIGQIYGTSAASCEGLTGQIAYLAAYDVMAEAIANFSADEQKYKAPATALLAQFQAFFPTKEECFFNEIEIGSSVTVECGAAKGLSTKVRTRD